MHNRRWFRTLRTLVVVAVLGIVGSPAMSVAGEVSSTFSGHHVNAGSVVHEVRAANTC